MSTPPENRAARLRRFPRPPADANATPAPAPAGSGSRVSRIVENITRDEFMPHRYSRGLALTGWGVSIFTVGWMVLYADFGEREHVYSGIRRRYRRMLDSVFSLTPEERSVYGAQQQAQLPAESRPINDAKPA